MVVSRVWLGFVGGGIRIDRVLFTYLRLRAFSRFSTYHRWLVVLTNPRSIRDWLFCHCVTAKPFKYLYRLCCLEDGTMQKSWSKKVCIWHSSGYWWNLSLSRLLALTNVFISLVSVIYVTWNRLTSWIIDRCHAVVELSFICHRRRACWVSRLPKIAQPFE